MAFDQWDDLMMSGGFRPRAELLGGLTLEQVSATPHGANNSIYQELWHAATVLEKSLASGRVALESWPWAEHFPESPAPADLAEWEELVERFIGSAREAVKRSADSGWLESPDPGYEEHGFTWRDSLEFLAVHTAYHMGKIVLMRQLVGAWPPRPSEDPDRQG